MAYLGKASVFHKNNVRVSSGFAQGLESITDQLVTVHVGAKKASEKFVTLFILLNQSVLTF